MRRIGSALLVSALVTIPLSGASPSGAADSCALGERTGREDSLRAAELAALHDCIVEAMRPAYARSGHRDAADFLDWELASSGFYRSATHGGRYVANYVDGPGSTYGAFEEAGPQPAGTRVAKPSFTLSLDGLLRLGPLFLMEKMPAGFSSDTGDWRYSMILPAGTVVGLTGGTGAERVGFCADCHARVGAAQDYLFFPPPEARPTTGGDER